MSRELEREERRAKEAEANAAKIRERLAKGRDRCKHKRLALGTEDDPTAIVCRDCLGIVGYQRDAREEEVVEEEDYGYEDDDE